ncbi:MAG: hypothetical protein M3069_07200 [Chloroflexota bacterium]|nr:hypothetical protein [Chloroflexota bacterium]
MLTFRAGNSDRPRGHALVFFRDADAADQIWATYLVVAPIKMDLGKYIPAAFSSQLAGQLAASGPAAYPLPPVPEKFDSGLEALERLAQLRSDDLLDGGTLRMSDPMYALQPVAEIGSQYAERCLSYFASLPSGPPAAEPLAATSSSSVDVDDLLLQVMPDRDKIGRLARLAGSLRYAIEGGDSNLVEETVRDMQRIARHLSEKYRSAELIAAAQSTDARGARLAELYLERCYRLVDEDYAAMADLDSKIEQLKPAS